MYIKQLKIKNFRCFSNLDLTFDGPITLVQGSNGAGKTTILEALHYICYMRSFRTHTPRDLIKFGSDNFFIKVVFGAQMGTRDNKSDNMVNMGKKTDVTDVSIASESHVKPVSHMSQVGHVNHELQVGFCKNKKVVKLNQKSIGSFKQLIDFYRVITLTEDDLEIIKGGPDVRRAFLDNAIFLFEPNILADIKDFKKVLENRNMLLQSQRVSKDSYSLWTEQLWEKSRVIQTKRRKILSEFEEKVNKSLSDVFDDGFYVELNYKPKNIDLDRSYEQFFGSIEPVKKQEMRFGRSLFGAHLDDFVITLQSKKSKVYASRGQQKLIVLLLKAAVGMVLGKKKGPAVFLLDDFMTDFDEEKAQKLADFLLSLRTQLIFTSPCRSGIFEDLLSKIEANNKIVLTY